MLKKVSILLMAITILFSSQISLMTETKAVGLDTAVKIVAGSSAQKVVRSIGEKMGVKWSKESLDATTDYINGQASKGNVIYADFGKKANDTAKLGTPSTKGGNFKKYVVDPLLWLSGADLILEAVDAFNNARNNDTELDFLGTPTTLSFTQTKCTSEQSCQYTVHVYGPGGHLDAFSFNPTWSIEPPIRMVQSDYYGSPKVTFYDAFDNLIYEKSYNYAAPNGLPTYNYDFDYPSGTTSRSRKVRQTDIPDISNVSNTWNTVTNNYSNDKTIINNYNYPLELEFEDNDSDSTKINQYDTKVYNPKIEDDDLTVIVKPIIDVDVTVPDDDSTVIKDEDGDIIIHNNNDVDIDLDGVEVTDPVKVPKNFFTSLTTMAEQLGDVYEGITTFFKKAVDGMKDLTDGMSGFVSFLDTFFDWLPSEFRTLLGVGFTLGVASFFLRR